MEENREKNNKKIEDEKRLEQDLRQMADDVILPDSLEPEAIQKMLQARQEEKAAGIKNEKEQKELETYRSDRSSGMCLCDSWSDSWNQADQQRKQQNIRCSDYRISSRSDRDNPDTYNSERL